MNRLTKRLFKGTTRNNGVGCAHFDSPECVIRSGNCTENCPWEEAVWGRLAAYEDAGLEPEDIVRAEAEAVLRKVGGVNMSNAGGILRGKINGKEEYCRILIRRRRAPLPEAIRFFTEAIVDGDKIIPEFSDTEQKELRIQQACFVTALVAMKEMLLRMSPAKEGEDAHGQV